MLYWRQLVSEREVAIEDLEVLEALAPDDHSLPLLYGEIQCGPLPLQSWVGYGDLENLKFYPGECKLP